MVRRGEILDDSMEDEFYLRRLDAGLFVLQLLCYIMVEVSSAGIPQVHANIPAYLSVSLRALYSYTTTVLKI